MDIVERLKGGDYDPLELGAEIERLREENEALQGQVERWYEKHAELRKQVAELRSCIERCVATTMTEYAHHQVMSDPSHFVNQAISAYEEFNK